MKKTSILLLIILVSSCSVNKNITENNVPFIKTVKEASYSAKRSGLIVRDSILLSKLDKISYYNEKGFLVKYQKYETDGSLYENTILIKNENDKLLKRITQDSKGKLKKYLTTKLDDKDNIIEYNTYNNQDELVNIQIKEYDSNGNNISFINKSIKSNRTFKTLYKYNTFREMIKETDYKPDSSIKDIRTYKYDKKGNEIEQHLNRPDGSFTKFVSEYDQFNNLILHNWFDKNGNQKHQTSFEYVYDNNGNWLTKKRYSNGELRYVWEREIEYY